MTSRSAPSSVAPVLSELELENPQIVTRTTLAGFAERAGISLPVDVIAERLQRHGWLLPLRTRGAWEFAPGSRAGAIGSGDPFIELRATLTRRPDLPVAVAYESAAWLQGLTERSPRKHVVSIDESESVPHSLRHFRVTRVRPNLPPDRVREVPVWSVESLVVLLGTRPAGFRDWPNIRNWLATAFAKADHDRIVTELQGRPAAAWMRTGYLVEYAGDAPLANRILHASPTGAGPFYLGPRDGPAHYSKKWSVRDSLVRGRMSSSSASEPPSSKRSGGDK